MPRRGWKQLRRLRGHEALVVDFAWSPSAREILSFDERGQFVIWNAETGKPLHALREPSGAIRTVAWAPSGDAIVFATEDDITLDPLRPSETLNEVYDDDPDDDLLSRFEVDSLMLQHEDDDPVYLRIVDVDSGLHIGAISFRSDTMRPRAVVWPRPDRLYTAAADGVSIWQARDGHHLGRLEDSQYERFMCLAATPDGSSVAAAGVEGNIIVWDSETGSVARSFESELAEFRTLSFSPGYARLAAGTAEGVVEVWSFNADEPDVRTLEAHATTVISTSFSYDGKILATASRDGTVKLWDTADWSLISDLPRKSEAVQTSVHFAPHGPLLAGATDGDLAVRIWELDLATLAARRRRPDTVHYTNAKVVLLGDTGVGKTGLGLVLSGQSFRATTSTHQRNVWPLPEFTGEPVENERREVFLWDLAGQPGYRLLHQLHLSDVAVALVVFDGRNELDPLSGVRHWARSLNQATRLAKRERSAIARVLVAARLDRGRALVGDDELRKTRQEFGFDKYVTTSAQEGKGIAVLLSEIGKAIDWTTQPKVSSTRLFDAIRAFLLQKRDTELVLATEAELREAFLATGAVNSREVIPEFRACVDRAQARGLVRRFSFGDLVLLKPEVLDAYAAAVLIAAGDKPGGLGEISEADVRAGSFEIPTDSRLDNRETERLLLIATIEDLLIHEVALREHSDDGSYLVFPSQSRQKIPVPKLLQPWARFRFEGPVQHVWTTLVVRLAHSGVFAPDGVGEDCAMFRDGVEAVGLRLHLIDEGEALIQLLGEGVTPRHLDRLLERFVEAHLKRRAVWDSVQYSRLLICPQCAFVIPDALLEVLGDVEMFNCPKCPTQITIGTQQHHAHSTPTRTEVRVLEQTADSERHRLAARTAAQGKQAVSEFDAFLAYNSIDFETVAALRDRLHDFGLNPWMDRERIPPGRWVQDVLQDAIGRSASAVICIGVSGLGKWQAIELKTFVEECVEKEIPVIPVLLPDAETPAEARFLRGLEHVRFLRGIDETEPLERLVWGITGDRLDSDDTR
jgi:WD40 repeat protein